MSSRTGRRSVVAPQSAHLGARRHAATSSRKGTPPSDLAPGDRGDKTPYKTHQGAYVSAGPATGWYVQISATGVRVGAGFYQASGEALASYREAVASRRGPALQRLLGDLVADGWEVGGERLKTAPRGYDATHPRIDLLRHKSLTVGKDYGFDEAIHTPALLDRVRADWQETRPLVTWLVRALAS